MMKKILLPIEETQRSLKALNYVQKHFGPDEAELVLLMIDEKLGYSVRSEAEAEAIRELDGKLALIAETMEGYKLSLISGVGKAGVRITRAARETGADLIVMTKSSKEDMLSSIGTTAEYVINNAPCDVIIVCEQVHNRNEYRGLVYRSAKGTVNLRGQLGDKQSECMLPSVNQDCIYTISVTVGKVRFFHTAYNPDTRNWDLPPLPGQEVTLDIAAGETKDILVKADSTDGKADRIRLVNRDMKKEAVFDFSIKAAPKEVVEAHEEHPFEPAGDADAAMTSRATLEVPRIGEDGRPMIPEGFVAPEVPTFMAEGRPAWDMPEPKAEETPASEPEPEPVVKLETPAEPEEPASRFGEYVSEIEVPFEEFSEYLGEKKKKEDAPKFGDAAAGDSVFTVDISE